MRALALYAEAVIRGDEALPWDILQKIERLRAAVDDCDVPEAVSRRLEQV